ncbi:MAG: DUF951 domain-containing protein [Clostridiales bacterium]|nr:DUF951 domain-containing protein [Clostridiales bacterium]
MVYELNSKIISKKPHACGGNEWQVVRVGADVKLKCLKCGRSVFFSIDQLNKMTKQYFPLKEKDV